MPERSEENTSGNFHVEHSPVCESTLSGTYKNSIGDIATVESVEGKSIPQDKVSIFLEQEDFQESLSFTYTTPIGYGIRETISDDIRNESPAGNQERSIYYSNLGSWKTAVFGEGNPFWYSDRRVNLQDSIWFRVLCTIDVEAAKNLSVPI
ncbi:MAG: hypothetical protein F6K00_23245 [Leptolyngbya sp. SIOISBB]|nr:hypothetical protein [Leptolyngbya sp. SIOISBB]